MHSTRLSRSVSALPLFLLFGCAAAPEEPSAERPPAEPPRALDDATVSQLEALGALGYGPGAEGFEPLAPARFPLETPEPSAERLREDVLWLADDAREGRRAGTAGEEAAARWLAERFAALGLEPAGEDGGWFQRFPVPLPARVGAGSRVRWIGHDDEGVVSDGAAVEPLFCSANGTARGPLVFVGHGIVLEERGWDDYAGVDAEGKIVAVLRGSPEEPAGEAEPEQESPHGVSASAGWGANATILHKVLEAKRHGAAGVVFLPRTPEEPPLPFDVGRSGESGLPAVCVPWEVYRRMQDAGEVEVSAEVIRETGTATNVLARLPGVDRSAAVLVGAHFDHLGRGGLGSLAPDAAGEIHNGADDNASGTAVVLELARVLAQADERPCDVVFALWSGEELGLLGSEHWAGDPTLPLADLRFCLNLDMVGRAGSGKLQVLGAGTAEPFGAWLAAGAEPAGLELTVNASGRGIGGSDHQTFLQRQIPALHFFSGVHTDYHRPSDDVERFEAEGAARVCALAVEVLAHAMQDVADGRPLAWVAPPEDDEPRAAGGFRTRFGSVPEYGFDGPGVLLAGTSPGGPAERGGLVRGDVVRAIGDVEIESVHDLMFALNSHKPGDVVLVRYLRNDEPREVRLTLDAPGLE